MTLRQYLSIMILSTLLCWLALGFVIYTVDPTQDTGLGFLFFYLSVFFSLTGTVSLVYFLFSSVFSRRFVPLFHQVQRTFVTGVLIAGFFVSVLYLQSKDIFTFWNFLIFFLTIIFLVLFKLSTKIGKSS